MLPNVIWTICSLRRWIQCFNQPKPNNQNIIERRWRERENWVEISLEFNVFINIKICTFEFNQKISSESVDFNVTGLHRQGKLHPRFASIAAQRNHLIDKIDRLQLQMKPFNNNKKKIEKNPAKTLWNVISCTLRLVRQQLVECISFCIVSSSGGGSGSTTTIAAMGM